MARGRSRRRRVRRRISRTGNPEHDLYSLHRLKPRFAIEESDAGTVFEDAEMGQSASQTDGASESLQACHRRPGTSGSANSNTPDANLMQTIFRRPLFSKCGPTDKSLPTSWNGEAFRFSLHQTSDKRRGRRIRRGVRPSALKGRTAATEASRRKPTLSAINAKSSGPSPTPRDVRFEGVTDSSPRASQRTTLDFIGIAF